MGFPQNWLWCRDLRTGILMEVVCGTPVRKRWEQETGQRGKLNCDVTTEPTIKPMRSFRAGLACRGVTLTGLWTFTLTSPWVWLPLERGYNLGWYRSLSLRAIPGQGAGYEFQQSTLLAAEEMRAWVWSREMQGTPAFTTPLFYLESHLP